MSSLSILHDPDRARRVGLVLAAASAVAAVVGLALFITAGSRLTESWMLHNATASLAGAVAFAAMVNKQPNNAAVWTLGWTLIASAFGQALAMGVAAAGVGRAIGTAAVRGEVGYTYGDLPGWLAWTIASVEVTWVLAVFPTVTLALLLFPDGQLPSRRWRGVAGMALGGMALVLVGLAVTGTPRSDLVPGAHLATPILNLIVGVGVLLLVAAILATMASLVVRYRAAVGDQRRQIRSDLATLPLEGGELPEFPASLEVPVRHDGELLGAVSLTKPRSEPPTRQDEVLAVRLARGLALMLRNARLTAELREHLQALEASRSRLLEAEGLGPAVAAQARKSTLPVTVHATGLPRYSAEVEVAVYFSILEALQNAAKYARASSVHVRLEQRDDGLWFEVADDGIGFDPDHTSHGSGLTGIAARLDTIDGVLDVASLPGTGTRITGRIPGSPQPAPALRVAMEVPA